MGYTIKEVSEKCNISAYTLRFYEKEGVLPPIQRDQSGHRTYSDKDLGLIQIIGCMRMTGMPMEYVKKYVELCIIGDSTLEERRQMTLTQKGIIENRIKDYNNLLALINWKLEYYDDRINGRDTATLMEKLNPKDMRFGAPYSGELFL